jgi:hypothetical protein
LGRSRKKKSINKENFLFKKKSLLVLFLFETNKQTTNALGSKKERKKE